MQVDPKSFVAAIQRYLHARQNDCDQALVGTTLDYDSGMRAAFAEVDRVIVVVAELIAEVPEVSP